MTSANPSGLSDEDHQKLWRPCNRCETPVLLPRTKYNSGKHANKEIFQCLNTGCHYVELPAAIMPKSSLDRFNSLRRTVQVGAPDKLCDCGRRMLKLPSSGIKNKGILFLKCGVCKKSVRAFDPTTGAVEVQPSRLEASPASSTASSTIATTTATTDARSPPPPQPDEHAANETMAPNAANHSLGPSVPPHPTQPPATDGRTALRLDDADFANIRMGRPIGEGSFGAAYECFLLSHFARKVCVKVLNIGKVDREDLPRLRKEIGIMKSLDHPNIVRYYGFTETTTNINIFMELVAGGSIPAYLSPFGADRRLPDNIARDWTRQILLGVEYLHGEGIVHRDIKGANILVTNDGVLKLSDFGSSKAVATTGCHTVSGTPFWLAPEVANDEHYDGKKADIWSVGCTVVEIVTGKHPWPAAWEPRVALFKVATSTGAPSGIPKDLSEEMLAFLERCFERDPTKRATATELLGDPWIIGPSAAV